MLKVHSQNHLFWREYVIRVDKFQTQSVTAGSAGIARDRGGSVWLDIYPRGIVDFEVGYCRSAEYDLNSFFFRVDLNLGDWSRSER